MKILSRNLLFTLLLISTNIYSVEIIPILGYRGGGDFIDEATDTTHTLESSDMYGLILSWPYERGKNIEVYYSHQSTKLNSITVNTPTPTGSTVDIPLTLDYLHVGGTAPILDDEKLKTFVTGGLGFTYASPDYPDTQSDLRASFSIGIGLKWPMTERISLRLETRGLATLYDNNSAIFCSGGCSVSVNGNLFLQGEVFAGIGFKF